MKEFGPFVGKFNTALVDCVHWFDYIISFNSYTTFHFVINWRKKKSNTFSKLNPVLFLSKMWTSVKHVSLFRRGCLVWGAKQSPVFFQRGVTLAGTVLSAGQWSHTAQANCTAQHWHCIWPCNLHRYTHLFNRSNAVQILVCIIN